MKLLIDDVNLEKIRKLNALYPIDGVTCNPTILAKNGGDPVAALKTIRELIGPEADLHVQAVSLETPAMIEEGRKIAAAFGPHTFVKIPAIPAGFKAMEALKNEGIGVTATAVYTPLQACLAAKAGADYVAPYINRIDNMGYDGLRVAKEIQDIFTKNGYDTGILAASFKNSQQVLELCAYGVKAATVAPDVIEQFVSNPAISSAVDQFVKDFEGLSGPGKTMLDLL